MPPWEKENHLQNAILGGYVSSLEGIYLHTVCGYPVDVFWCIFVGIYLFLYVFYLLICRCLDVVHIVQK